MGDDGTFSNTALARQLKQTGDWVVIYFGRPGEKKHQRMMVSETRGPLEGKRVVRGRESECREFHLGARSTSAAGVH